MDLDDSFTEKLLQRNKERRQFISIKENECPGVVIKRRPALIDEQQIRNQETLEVSPKRSLDDEADDSPKRQCIERCEGSPSRQWPPKQTKWEKENNPSRNSSEESFIPFKASLKERGLAALRKKDNSDSDITASGLTSKAEVGDNQKYIFSTNSSDLCSGRKARLAHLAAHINQWEDDLHRPTDSTNFVAAARSKLSSVDTPDSVSTTSNLLPGASSTLSENVSKIDVKPNVAVASVSKPGLLSPSKIKNFDNSSKSVKNKLGVWDQAIKAALESEDIGKPPKKRLNENREFIEEDRPVNKNSSNNSVKSSLQQFKDKHVKEDLNRSFDPTDLPLSARRALFEQASQLENAKPKEHSFEPKLSVAQRAALFENASQRSLVSKPLAHTAKNISPQKPNTMASINARSPLKTLLTPEKTPKQESTKVLGSPIVKASPIKKINTDTQAVEKMLLARVNSKMQIEENVSEQEEVKDKAELVNYWEKLSASSKSGNSHSEEDITEKQDIPESDMYQSEDDQDGYESETESKYERESESEFNYNTEITETEYSESDHESDSPSENVFKSPKGFPIGSSHAPKPCISGTTKERNLWQADNYTDDTCDATSLSDGSSYAESTISTDIRSVGTQPSYPSSCSSVGSSYDPESSKESEENFIKSLPSELRESNSATPLLYTVSFYRKQRQETKTPPMKSIVRREQVSTPSADNQKDSIQEEIKIYQEEIVKQQTIIGQTSQALNLCHATAEFSGSTEQVEGERLLLIATQKRQALLNEIQRLKTLGAEGEVPDGTGTLTISDLQLPLKQEFLAAQLEGKINDAVHWFLCLIRHGAQVIVTQMMSTDEKVTNGALCFTNHIKLQNLPPDFSIVFEVYALQTKKESLPHDKKYHIKRDKSTLRLASKGKKSDGKLLLPAISSPGGPNAVRSSSFGVIGFTRFSIQNCNKKCFTLDKVPFSSPLEGILRVRLHLHAEHKVMEKGFLTMFEDVSGFGAWHRRWCALNSQHLTYWKYPDDECKKEPIGSIDLKQCVTGYVKPVSRDICARPHTFQLVTIRPQEKGDKNTLISYCANTVTTTKHLLAADTKEERVLWCDKLNEALSNVRKWDPHALRPKETNL
ncbi:anillin isoform X2 [Parasteatoda tepidariorum]|uniref:anillin isoform X2 n=1 Tax=Parasteatoda tepidariorum TaxID=114398 RepID=UPI001C722524|nr:anillin isoform X2 [Parasteatoda tepidariorum]